MREGIGAEGCFEGLLVAGRIECGLLAQQGVQHGLRQVRDKLAIPEQCPRDLPGLE